MAQNTNFLYSEKDYPWVSSRFCFEGNMFLKNMTSFIAVCFQAKSLLLKVIFITWNNQIVRYDLKYIFFFNL